MDRHPQPVRQTFQINMTPTPPQLLNILGTSATPLRPQPPSSHLRAPISLLRAPRSQLPTPRSQQNATRFSFSLSNFYFISPRLVLLPCPPASFQDNDSSSRCL